MNLSDRIKEVFGLENEPNCELSIDLDSGDLNINCSPEAICDYIRRNCLERLVRGGVELQIPQVNLKHNNKLIYRFPPSLVLDYGIRRGDYKQRQEGDRYSNES